MRLQSIEIKGFKSFANHTVINFNEDVIGIVGPNGSGKSNVIDAIRWVLGEQKSKHLRLEKMTNVIFNGTKTRKAGGVAEVSMTFENSKNILPTQYNNVKITRILYRSGESEYSLNGVKCRLKDITALFLDTGIGSNSYAIIELAMVDRILSDKDNSRRSMFEQAAGISKFKKRKKETLSRLKATTQNLDRVEDLIFEIEGNLKTLEKQAKRARKYYEIKDEYKVLSLDLAVYKLADLKEKYKNLKEKLQIESDESIRLQTLINKVESEIESNKRANLSNEQALSNKQRAINTFLEEIRKDESDKGRFEQKIDFILRNQAKIEKESEEALFKKEKLEEELEYYETEVIQEQRVEQKLEDVLVDAEETMKKIKGSHGSTKSDLDQFLKNQQRLEKEVFEFEKQTAINENRLNNLNKDLEHRKLSLSQRSNEAQALETEILELEQETQKIKSELEAVEQKEKERKESIEKLIIEQQDSKSILSKSHRQLDAQQNEYQLTKSMIENLEGFPESIRFLSKQDGWADNIPLLSDILYAKEDYRLAIENYLSPYLNYFVVPDAKTAYEAVHLLQKAQKGKANFFILDAFERLKPAKIKSTVGESALDIIEIEDKYRKIAEYLLWNVRVVDKDGLKENIEEDLVILSKSGQLVQHSFRVQGGSIGLFEGKKIGRKKNLEKLEASILILKEEIVKQEKVVKRVEDELKSLRKNDFSADLNKLRQNFQQVNSVMVAQKTKIESYLRQKAEFDEKSNQVNAEIKEINEKQGLIAANFKRKSSELDNVLNSISQLDRDYQKISSSVNQASQEYNNSNIEFIRQQNKVNTLRKELNFRKKQLEELEIVIEKNLVTSDREKMDLEDSKSKISIIKASLLQKYEKKQVLLNELNQVEQNYFKGRSGIDEMEDSLRKNNRLFNQNQLKVADTKEAVNEINISLSSIGERLNIEFGIHINDVLNEKPKEDLNIEVVEPRVMKLRKRLENYGEINPMAVEAFDEMKTRYDDLSKQKKDIEDAKISLLDTIAEIEVSATKQFVEAFDKVKVNFKKVFRSLFTEDDDCDLILADESDPLESPIHIVARPKGKKPQSISLLSGGEKTLTATALLFALYLLKPAPFCIFDEVDAPLDDANIDKFNNIIKEFSGDSQFIIVTHNKQTMAAVDVIYGVYMHEPGVSGVSEVDFRNLEHTAKLETAMKRN